MASQPTPSRAVVKGNHFQPTLECHWVPNQYHSQHPCHGKTGASSGLEQVSRGMQIEHGMEWDDAEMGVDAPYQSAKAGTLNQGSTTDGVPVCEILCVSVCVHVCVCLPKLPWR